ncbi:MAG: hypothetical protein EPN23_09315 [Verrucomicrobia bacterium]|nr:MAG: hypothetical protein EPN23_09315 [Verrucomicrobiota bacterium]
MRVVKESVQMKTDSGKSETACPSNPGDAGSFRMSRRQAMTLGASVAGIALLPSLVKSKPVGGQDQQTSRVTEYKDLRGFNYQPSWGATGEGIWLHFDEAKCGQELDQIRRYFPKCTVLRIWLSYHAWGIDRLKFLAAAGKMAALIKERKLQMMPVYFNGWGAEGMHPFGSFAQHWIGSQKPWTIYKQYLTETVQEISEKGDLLAHDISNEPYNGYYWDEKIRGDITEFLKAMASEIRSITPDTPIGVGSQGTWLADLDMLNPFVDIFYIHPYVYGRYSQPDKLEKKLSEFDGMMAKLRQLNKPVISNECCWGSNNDAGRAETIKQELTLLKQHGIGFLPHAAHHSWVADLHRPRPDYKTWSMYMGFIDPNGSIRSGHEIYNEF